jgi:type I restriction enzyme, S subunit
MPGDALELAYGKALKAADRRPGDIPVYGSNGRVGWHDEALSSGPGVVVGRKGNPGTVTWVAGDRFSAIDTTFYVVPRSPGVPMRWIFHALGELSLGGLAADSAVPGVNREIIYHTPLVLPPSDRLLAFDAAVDPLWRRVRANESESSTLAALRDLLLPKLLSGEVRVSSRHDTLSPDFRNG